MKYFETYFGNFQFEIYHIFEPIFILHHKYDGEKNNKASLLPFKMKKNPMLNHPLYSIKINQFQKENLISK